MKTMGTNCIIKDDGLPCVVWQQYPGMFLTSNEKILGGKWQTIEAALNRDQSGRLYIHLAEWEPARSAYSETIYPGLLAKLKAKMEGKTLEPETRHHPAVPARPIPETEVTFWADELVGFAVSGQSKQVHNPPDPKRSARYPSGSTALIPAKLLADLGHGRTVEVARHFAGNDEELGNLRAELSRVFVHQDWQPPRPAPLATFGYGSPQPVTMPTVAGPYARPASSIDDDVI